MEQAKYFDSLEYLSKKMSKTIKEKLHNDIVQEISISVEEKKAQDLMRVIVYNMEYKKKLIYSLSKETYIEEEILFSVLRKYSKFFDFNYTHYTGDKKDIEVTLNRKGIALYNLLEKQNI